jgi:hypothetical protein
MDPKNKLPPWLKPKKLPAKLVLRVGWYTHENWTKVKHACVDPDRLEASYEEWLDMAEGALADLKASGLNPARSLIEADDLLAWCLAHDKINDAAARSEYVAQQAAESDETDI